MSDLRKSFGPTPECPALDALAAATPDPAVQLHLESCTHCRDELRMFQEFERAEPRSEETADLAWVNAELSRRRSAPKPSLADRFRAWLTFPRLSMAAAALLMIVAAALYLPTRSGSVLPDAQENPVWRSGQFAAIAPAGDLSRAPSELRWEAVTGTASYHVRVLEVDGTEIWSADVNGTSVALPSNVVVQMTGGRAFRWDVAAQDSAGRTIAKTALQSFHILATPR